MPDYQKMYLHLFNKVSFSLLLMEQQDYSSAEKLMKKAQCDCEEMYMEEEESETILRSARDDRSES